MISSIGNSRKRVFAFNSKSISTQLKKIIALLLKSRREGSFWPKFKSVTESRWFNFYGTIVLVLFVLIFKGAGQGQDTLFSNLLKKTLEETSASVIIVSQSQNQLADINSLVALSGQDSGQGGGPETSNLDPSTVQENSLMASNPSTTDYINSFKADQVVEYTVQPGDSIGIIASDFGVSVDTIIWANNIRNPNVLSLGQVLKIPPVTGVIHTVKAGDTVASIAKKYKADPEKILSFNKLDDDKTLILGNEIIVPDGQLSGPKPSVKSIAQNSSGSGIYKPVGDGQCVAFVQAHGFANMHGNAYQWKKYINTPVPVAGGAVVFKGGRWGHIAIITAVKESSIQVVEQNFYGPYIIDHREISLTDRAIVGFIQ